MVWRAGTAAQNWGEAPAPQAQCATPLGLSLSEGLGPTRRSVRKGKVLCKPLVFEFRHGLELQVTATFA
jgi:hypothetical protein